MGRELPVLFNTYMVCAVLREAPANKTVTRRVIKGYIPDDAVFGYSALTPKGYISCRGTFAVGYGEKFFKLPCQKGDILYVRETWHKYKKRVGEGESCRLQEFYGYKASVANSEDAEEKWRPSIHMPKEAARIWLKVTDVRAERLQDMKLFDFLDEGIVLRPEAFNDPENAYLQARDIFKGIWDSTISKAKLPEYGWDANPWVWVIEFERCEKPAEGKEADRWTD